MNIVMYEDGWESAVQSILEERDDSAKTVTSGWIQTAKGTTVQVSLSSPELGIVGKREAHWLGRYLRFDFVFKVPKALLGNELLFDADVLFDDVPATHLSFIVGIGSSRGAVSSVVRKDVSSAFMSYANKDRGHVATIAQGIEAIRPDLNIFLDVESLRTGSDWHRALNEEITQSDILFLCWSRAASKSEWVDYEWRYAYKSKGLDAIQPIAIEPPDMCPPPTELSSKHFNSRWLYIANAH